MRQESIDRLGRFLRKLLRPVGLVLAGYLLLAYLPIFPHQPICMAGYWNVTTISGPLSRDYRIALAKNLAAFEVAFVTIGDRVFLSFYDWLDSEDWVLNASGRAVKEVVETRELKLSGGGTRDEIYRVEVEDDCAVVRAVAIKHPAAP